MKNARPNQTRLVENKIFLLRGQKVMLSFHLAELYGVKTKVLLQAVRRNKERFPKDFMFRLSWQEVQSLASQAVIFEEEALPQTSRNVTSADGKEYSRSQIVTLKKGANIKYRPYAFTEQGVSMLSSVLRSRQAIRVNIVIMRAFVKLRRFLAMNHKLAKKLSELENKVSGHEVDIRQIYQLIRQLMAPLPETPRRVIGFHP